MTVERDALRAAAAAATPGPWIWRQGPAGEFSDLAMPITLPGGIAGHPHNVLKVTNDWPPAVPDAQFIAAANPTVVTRLLDDIDEIAAERDALAAALARAVTAHGPVAAPWTPQVSDDGEVQVVSATGAVLAHCDTEADAERVCAAVNRQLGSGVA